MLERTLVLSGALIVGLILFLPSGDEGGVDDVQSAQPDTQSRPIRVGNNRATKADSSWYSGSHSLTRQGDGHFYADGLVQGASVRFLVDTGASVVALTGDDAYAVGLRWDDSNVHIIGSGASGPVYGVSRRINELEIGGITRRNVDAVIIPRGLDISLLGQSFLSKVESVEISGDEMILQDG